MIDHLPKNAWRGNIGSSDTKSLVNLEHAELGSSGRICVRRNSGHAVKDLRIEIVGTEHDTFDPDDWLGKCTSVLCGPAEGWFGNYGPRSGEITPEDVGPWRIWYRIERGAS